MTITPSNADLQRQIDDIVTRLGRIEKDVKLQNTYWAEMRGGRRVVFWILSGVGVVAGVAVAFWKAKGGGS